MQIDFRTIDSARIYNLLTNLVVPRPIAWVTSLNTAGVINLAPFSYFNLVGSVPPVVVVSVGMDAAGAPKHTAKNVAVSGEFVVNLVTEDLLDAMNLSAADFPADISELSAAGLDTAPSARVAVPRVRQAKAALECRLHSLVPIGQNNIILGEVLALHVNDSIIDDKLHIHDFAPLGRLGSPDVYCRTTDRLQKRRLTYAQWKAAQE